MGVEGFFLKFAFCCFFSLSLLQLTNSLASPAGEWRPVSSADPYPDVQYFIGTNASDGFTNPILNSYNQTQSVFGDYAGFKKYGDVMYVNYPNADRVNGFNYPIITMKGDHIYNDQVIPKLGDSYYDVVKFISRPSLASFGIFPTHYRYIQDSQVLMVYNETMNTDHSNAVFSGTIMYPSVREYVESDFVLEPYMRFKYKPGITSYNPNVWNFSINDWISKIWLSYYVYTTHYPNLFRGHYDTFDSYRSKTNIQSNTNELFDRYGWKYNYRSSTADSINILDSQPIRNVAGNLLSLSTPNNALSILQRPFKMKQNINYKITAKLRMVNRASGALSGSCSISIIGGKAKDINLSLSNPSTNFSNLSLEFASASSSLEQIQGQLLVQSNSALCYFDDIIVQENYECKEVVRENDGHPYFTGAPQYNILNFDQWIPEYNNAQDFIGDLSSTATGP